MALYRAPDSLEPIVQGFTLWVPIQGAQARVGFEVPAAMRVQVLRKRSEFPRDEFDGDPVLDQYFPAPASTVHLDTTLPVEDVTRWYYRAFSGDAATFNENTSRTALVHPAGFNAELCLRNGLLPQIALEFDGQPRLVEEAMDTVQGLVNPGIVPQELGALGRLLLSMCPAFDQADAHLTDVLRNGVSVLHSPPEVLEQLGESLGYKLPITRDINFLRALILSLPWIFKQVGTSQLIVWLGKFALNGYVPHVQEMTCVPHTFADPETWR